MNTKGIKPQYGFNNNTNDGTVMFPILYIDSDFGFYRNSTNRFECFASDDKSRESAIEHCEYVIEVAKAFDLKSLVDKIGEERDAHGKSKLFVSFDKRSDSKDRLLSKSILQLPEKDIFGDPIGCRRNKKNLSYQLLYVKVKEDELKEAFESRGLEYPGRDKLNYGVIEQYNSSKTLDSETTTVTYIPRRRR